MLTKTLLLVVVALRLAADVLSGVVLVPKAPAAPLSVRAGVVITPPGAMVALVVPVRRIVTLGALIPPT